MENDRIMALVLGIVLVLVGLLAIIMPSAVVGSFLLLIGAVLLIFGVLTGGIALSAEPGLPKTLLFSSALISIVIGLLVVLSPFVAIIGIAYLIGLWLLFYGVTTVAYAFSVNWAAHRAITAVVGIIGIMVALYLFLYPLMGINVLTMVIGYFFVISGIIYLILTICYWRK